MWSLVVVEGDSNKEEVAWVLQLLSVAAVVGNGPGKESGSSAGTSVPEVLRLWLWLWLDTNNVGTGSGTGLDTGKRVDTVDRSELLLWSLSLSWLEAPQWSSWLSGSSEQVCKDHTVSLFNERM